VRGLDLGSWSAVLSTVTSLVLVTVLGVGLRLLAMYTIQQRRERENRQINERLRTLIAAYKTLGGSFTGDLAVDPRHLRDLRRAAERGVSGAGDGAAAPTLVDGEGSDRARRVRDAVEAALSDIILLGTETHVRLAERAARELVAGRPVHVDELVVSLRAFIREALGLDPVPRDLEIPRQGPLRPATGGGGGGRGRGEGGGRDGGRQGGGGGGGGGGMGGMAAMGGAGAAIVVDGSDAHEPRDGA
jgi:uncharacterized membrane protein YgcG